MRLTGYYINVLTQLRSHLKMVWTKSEMKLISKLFEPLQKFTLNDFLTIEQLKAIEIYPAAAANLQNKAWNLPKVRT